MTEQNLGVWEEDPRSVAGARALATMSSQHETAKTEKWGLEPDLDPRVVATNAAIRDERTWDAYRQSGAWTMQAGQEYSPTEQ